MNAKNTEFTMTDGQRRHGGLDQSVHNTGHIPATRPGAYSSDDARTTPHNYCQANGPVQGQVKVPVYNSIHGPTYRLSNGRTYSSGNSASNGFVNGPLNPHASASPPGNPRTKLPDNEPVDTKLVDAKPIEIKHRETDEDFYNQFQCLVQDSHKIEPMTSAYMLQDFYRDELWDGVQMKMPKYRGYESWAIPFPAGMDFDKLVIVGGNTTYEFFDTRFVRIMFRDHLDKDGKWLAKDILLTPCNPSIQLTDMRLHSALMDGYWKLSRWLARLMSGDKVNLYTFLKNDLQNEVKAKKERTI